jgi:hypothetical protein
MGGTHTLMRVKFMSIYLDQIIGNREIGYPIRPNLKKYHYTVTYDNTNINNEISYEKFNYDIIKTNINPYADGLMNEIWPLLRTLWRARGGYNITINFSPEIDMAEFGNQYGTGKYTAKFNFLIDNTGTWSANFKWNFIQHCEFNPYREQSRQGPFFAQDFSKMTSNAAIRARKLAKPSWGMEGRNGKEFMDIINEEIFLNNTIDWSFNHDWEESGDWSNHTDYQIPVSNNVDDLKNIQPIKFYR